MLFWGMWLRGVGLSSSLTLVRRWKRNHRAAKKKGLGMHNGTSFTGGYSGPLTLLSMECRFLCGINLVHADVAGQWLYNTQTFDWCSCFIRCTHLQWCGAWTGEEPPRLCSFSDTSFPKLTPKRRGKTRLQKVKSAFGMLNCPLCWTNLLVSRLMVPLARTHSAGTKTWLTLAS